MPLEKTTSAVSKLLPSKTKKTKPGKSKPSRTKPAVAPAVKKPGKKTGESGTYQGYCVKCKEKEVSFEGQVEITEKGMKIAKGPHTACGTTVCRILGKA